MEESPLEKPRVLFVDDNEATCTLVSAVLRRDFVVETASDGFEAIENLKSRHYAAILLDLLMPVADGFVVLDYLAAERPAELSSVLVVTAALSPRELDRVRAYPVCGIIPKPFEVDVLLAAVKRCAGEGDELPRLRGSLLSSGMLLLFADLLRRV